MENIKNKVFVITGASGGLGAATACKLVQYSAKAVLAARREQALKRLTDGPGEIRCT